MAVAPVHCKDGKISVHWTTVGVQPESFTVAIDGQTVETAAGGTGVSLSSEELTPGDHLLTVTANGVGTRYALSPYDLDTPSAEPMPVEVSKKFRVE